jgi:large subunit ribosomal protein L46
MAHLGRLASPPLAALLRACGAAGTAPPLAARALAAAAAAAEPSASAAAAIHVAVVFERLPVIMPPPAEWEAEYMAWADARAAAAAKPLPPLFTDAKASAADAAGGGAARWAPAPRETAADAAGDRASLRRRLDQRLFMLVRGGSGGGGGGGWGFPRVALRPGETTRAGAERALAKALGPDAGGVQPYFVGNAPAGHAPLSGSDAAGAGGLLFFHRCQLVKGTPALAAGAAWRELLWAARDELGEYVESPEQLALLRLML